MKNDKSSIIMVNMGLSKEKIDQILKAREEKNLTQAEVAKKAGLSTNYYAAVERGEENISLDKLKKILEVLAITITLP